MSFMQYIDTHLLRKITIGKSGANVYELDHGLIAKHIYRNMLPQDSLWDSYVNEYMFYKTYHSENISFLPEIYHLYQSDHEIQMIMKKYTPFNKKDMDDRLFRKMISVLAEIHCLSIPNFLPKKEIIPFQLNDAELAKSFMGWLEVTREHGEIFSESDLKMVAKNINTVNQRFYNTKKWFCHGDFHFENVLADDLENLIVCDWQGIHSGHIAGDIAFFISRLCADGYKVNEEKVISMYCGISDVDITEKELAIQMKLSNVNTSFVFWHEYLHRCSSERVRNVFEKMIRDMEYLYQY